MVKVFGADLDPLDIPERVDIKKAYLNCVQENKLSGSELLDPYDVLKSRLGEKYARNSRVEWIGKFPVDSWLRPKPLIEDWKKVSQEKYAEFLEQNGCYGYCNELLDYLRENIGSAIPLMIGVDHSLTGGVLRYLNERYVDYNVIIFDSHCDLIDIETRKLYYGYLGESFNDQHKENDIYECGSFLNHMLKEGIVKPHNLWIIGTQDLERIKSSAEIVYLKKILPWIKKGMHIMSKDELISFGIPHEIKGQTYISFDMDLGSLNSVFAARYLDYIGVDPLQFSCLISDLSEKIKKKEIELIGLDIMEVDVHFLGVDMHGKKDVTAEIMNEIYEKIIVSNF